MGIRQRGGPLRLVHVKDNRADTLYEVVAKHVDAKETKATVTDDAGAYNFRLTKFYNIPHSKIRHSRGEYVKRRCPHQHRGEFLLTPQACRNRDVSPAFDKASPGYLNEFSYRFNRREDAEMVENTVERMVGVKPMPYAKLIEENAFTPFVRPN